jgi:hypothetical protein
MLQRFALLGRGHPGMARLDLRQQVADEIGPIRLFGA